MKLYITFGQSHTHRVNNVTFDKDLVAIIKCDNYHHGREIARELFNNVYATSYTEDQVDEKFMSHFPRGATPANY